VASTFQLLPFRVSLDRVRVLIGQSELKGVPKMCGALLLCMYSTDTVLLFGWDGLVQKQRFILLQCTVDHLLTTVAFSSLHSTVKIA
jgi:hypothetical protein